MVQTGCLYYRNRSSHLLFIFALVIGIFLWAFWVAATHPAYTIVSWDEGFHGGAAFFISRVLHDPVNFKNYLYLAKEFVNGLIWYFPLWSGLAGLFGAIFGPSVEIYRITTEVLAGLSLILVAMFVKEAGGIKASLVAVAALAFAPLFVVYSHLMMLEVPLLFSTALGLLFYYRYLSLKNPGLRDWCLTALFLTIGIMTKVVAVAIILSTILVFGAALAIFYRGSQQWRRFWSKQTLLMLICPLAMFLGFLSLSQVFLKVNMLTFYLNQNGQLAGSQSSWPGAFLTTLSGNLTFYLRDFSHMPALAVVWFGSTLAYFILKRSPLSAYLITWASVTYLLLSAVKPQAVQYILPILAPLSIGVGLFWGEFFKNRPKVVRLLSFPAVLLLLMWLGFRSLPQTEAYFWRTLVTNQDLAVSYIVEQANTGDFVIASGDGTRLLVYLLGEGKSLQTINAASRHFRPEDKINSQWVLVDFGPQNPIRLTGFDPPNWEERNFFPNSLEGIKVLQKTHVNKNL